MQTRKESLTKVRGSPASDLLRIVSNLELEFQAIFARSLECHCGKCSGDVRFCQNCFLARYTSQISSQLEQWVIFLQFFTFVCDNVQLWV